MDILLFIIGLFALIRNKLASTITIIFVLCSTYLQLNIPDPHFSNAFFEHNVMDVGLILYILFFLKVAFRYGINWRGSLQKTVTLFLLFLIINGGYDIVHCGTSFGDVIRYLRLWMLLTIVYVAPRIPSCFTIRSFRQVGIITVVVSSLVIFQLLTSIELIEFRRVAERGIKPPITAIIYGAFYILNYWKLSKLKTYTASALCVIPILLSLKMTYAISVLLITLVAIYFSKSIGSGKKVFYPIAILVVSILFLTANNSFSERFRTMYSETETISSGEVSGNFSYRILHASERFNYIIATPETAIRGIGYVSETNFYRSPFVLGVYNAERERVDQLDNGDILWSNVFVRIGLFGVILYAWMFYKLTMAFYKGRKTYSTYDYWFSYLLISLIFTSLGNDTMGHGFFFLYPYLMIYSNTKAI
jgi:hypothetical protein